MRPSATCWSQRSEFTRGCGLSLPHPLSIEADIPVPHPEDPVRADGQAETVRQHSSHPLQVDQGVWVCSMCGGVWG